ncbi:hypothetical protein [Roseateles asaccharophilus]|uniref:hypothetical protein n=1 Tax=Roseateles asaccharophilus TaxID=582607 RepID=UPI003850A7B2
MPSQATGVYWQVSSAFIEELATFLRGKRVLEIFAGNGYLAACLSQRGIAIRPTSRLSGHDCHELGLYADVEEIDAVSAVSAYGADADVLLMSWPTVTPAAYRAALLWGRDRPICYIGEMTDREADRLGGCATDEFFEAIDVIHRFKHYNGRATDFAVVCKTR